MSKVKQNIENIKKPDKALKAANKNKRLDQTGQGLLLDSNATKDTSKVQGDFNKRFQEKSKTTKTTTLEDLYGIDEQISQSSSTARIELRKTLRELKEKELLVLKLREACHDLTIKYADAENTIDQLRFGTIGRNTSNKTNSAVNVNGNSMTKSKSAFCLAGGLTDENSSVMHAKLQASVQTSKKETKDQATLTSPIKVRSPQTTTVEQLAQDAGEGAADGPDTSLNDEYNSWSSFDVLDESCSNWMEKVQNWKTLESQFNTSADADSGFRGSDINPGTPETPAIINAAAGVTSLNHSTVIPVLGPVATTNSSSGGCSRKHISESNILKYLNSRFGDPSKYLYGPHKTAVSTNSQGTNTEYLPQLGSIKATVDPMNSENMDTVKYSTSKVNKSTFSNYAIFSNPQFQSQSQLPLTDNAIRHIRSQSYNDLQEPNDIDLTDFNNKQTHPKLSDKSMKSSFPTKRYSMTSTTTMANELEDNKPLYYSASVSYFNKLDPLLDDATKLAKRVQRKSEKLAKQLQQTLNESKRKN